MAYLDVKTETLIFADADRNAGGIVNASTGGRAAIVTAPVLAALEATLFEGTALPQRLVKLAEPANARALVAGKRPPSEIPFLPGLELTRTKPAMGRATRSVNATEGLIRVREIELWRPAGEMRSRRVGAATVHLVIAPQSLTGKLRPAKDFSVVQFVDAPLLRAEGSSCGTCSTCGVCGICTLCAEINAASGLAAAVAITALSNMGVASFDVASAVRTRAQLRLSPTQEAVLTALDRLAQ